MEISPNKGRGEHSPSIPTDTSREAQPGTEPACDSALPEQRTASAQECALGEVTWVRVWAQAWCLVRKLQQSSTRTDVMPRPGSP